MIIYIYSMVFLCLVYGSMMGIIWDLGTVGSGNIWIMIAVVVGWHNMLRDFWDGTDFFKYEIIDMSQYEV